MKTMRKDEFDADELNLISLAQEYSDEDKARELLERMRWPHGPVCPHCKNDGNAKPISKLTPKEGNKTHVRNGVYFCGACRKQFTVTVRTVFEGSHIPISKWLMAWFIICSSKKAVSAHQLHRMLNITYRSAWFLAHRIRFALGDDPKAKLTGVVEVDETFIGGKGDARTKLSRKTPVVALIEQGGNMKARVVPNVSQRNLGAALHECISKDAVLCTDEHGGYRKEGKQFKAHHTAQLTGGIWLAEEGKSRKLIDEICNNYAETKSWPINMNQKHIVLIYFRLVQAERRAQELTRASHTQNQSPAELDSERQTALKQLLVDYWHSGGRAKWLTS